MESFPEDFTLENSMKEMENNQRTMTNNVRKQFFDDTKKAIDGSEPFVKLTFPKNLWPIHRIKITTEIIDRFGEVETITNNQKTNSVVSIPVTDVNNVSKSIDSIIIRFMRQ